MNPRGAPMAKKLNATSLACPGGNVEDRIPSAADAMAAALRPCSPRIASKPLSFGTKGSIIDAAVKNDEPRRNVRRRP